MNMDKPEWERDWERAEKFAQKIEPAPPLPPIAAALAAFFASGLVSVVALGFAGVEEYYANRATYWTGFAFGAVAFLICKAMQRAHDKVLARELDR